MSTLSLGGKVMKKKRTWLAFLNVVLWMIPLFLVLLLPLYYKIIWPPFIGSPAKAETVDVLAFWGAVFGGVITLVGVFMTIRFTQKEMEQSSYQYERNQFIKSFGSTVLEINSIIFEIKKFREYIRKFQTSIIQYIESGTFEEIIIEFDTKEDYKKIKDSIKPDLEIIIKRFEGKAAHADGFVYYQIRELGLEIEKLQLELYRVIDQNDVTGENAHRNELNTVFQRIHTSLTSCERKLRNYKGKLGKKFIEYSEMEGYMEAASEKF